MIVHSKLARVEKVSRSADGKTAVIAYVFETEEGPRKASQELSGTAIAAVPEVGATVSISVDEQGRVVGAPRLPPDNRLKASALRQPRDV